MKQKIQREHFALSVLFSIVIFLIQLISLVIAGVIAYLLMKLGVLSGFGISKEGGGLLLLLWS